MGDQNTDARTGLQIKGRQRHALLHLSYLPNLWRWLCQQPSIQTLSECKHDDWSEREIYLSSLNLQEYTAQIRKFCSKWAESKYIEFRFRMSKRYSFFSFNLISVYYISTFTSVIIMEKKLDMSLLNDKSTENLFTEDSLRCLRVFAEF